MELQRAEFRDIKQMPSDKATREAIQRCAKDLARDLSQNNPPSWDDLVSRGMVLLESLGLPDTFLGYAMVCLSNEFWIGRFSSIPMSRRLLLLPHCLNSRGVCIGTYDAEGLTCANCGACVIPSIEARARELGYQVLVAEGTPAVLMKVLEGSADAILGVACLDSLERSHARLSGMGIPHVAVPLLKDGCENTEVDVADINSILELKSTAKYESTKTYVPLLRFASNLFADDVLSELISTLDQASGVVPDAMHKTEQVAFDYLRAGGKRLRPFITVAAYAVGAFGAKATSSDFDPSVAVPVSVQRVGVAIECMHKASLVHDDIEDGDAVRYGQEAIHGKLGTGPAINVGDYLIGLGYRLIAGESLALGAECVAEILQCLSKAHLELCKGQGAELLWEGPSIRPAEALTIYSLKTAPAFEAALFAGLRAANIAVDRVLLKRFCAYLGEGYQVLNDLDDWNASKGDHSAIGADVIASRPTILRAFAIDAGGGDALAALDETTSDPKTAASCIYKLYTDLGVFDRANNLVEKLRERALEVALAFESQSVREYLAFLVRIVLPGRSG